MPGPIKPREKQETRPDTKKGRFFMSEQELCWMSAVELLDAYRSKKLSPVEVTRAVLERIDEVNPKINAVVTLTADLAMEQARAAEEAYQKGKAAALAGVPATVKDLICTGGIRTTFGSRLFEDYVPDEDAVLVERLKEAGVVILGKTNVPEFGLVAVTDNLIFGPALNPWDTRNCLLYTSDAADDLLCVDLGGRRI